MEAISPSSRAFVLNSERSHQWTQGVKDKLADLAIKAQDSKSSWRVVCHNDSVSVKWHWLQLIWHIFSGVFEYFDPTYLSDNKKTIEYFHEVFGKRRIEKWEKNPRYHGDFDLSYRNEEGLEITKKELEKLFSAMSCVTKSDVKDLLNDILANIKVCTAKDLIDDKTRSLWKGWNANDIKYVEPHCPQKILYLTEEQTSQLVSHFLEKTKEIKKKEGGIAREVTIEDLTTDELDFFYDILKPFSYSTASLNSSENKDQGNNRGYTIEGLLPLSGKIEEIKQLYQKPHPLEALSPTAVSKENKEEDWSYQDIKAEVAISKKIVGYYNPDGMMIRTKKGWYFVERKIKSAGMYIVYLRAVNATNPDRVHFLHTQTTNPFLPAHWGWQPLREILSRDPGQKSIRQADELREIITKKIADPSFQIEIFGYSLGGAGACRFFADCLSRLPKRHFVTRLTTFSGLGIDRRTADWIDSDLASRVERTKIAIIRNYGDSVSNAGKKSPFPDNLIILCDGENELEECKKDPNQTRKMRNNLWGLLKKVFRDINTSHCKEVSKDTRIVHYKKGNPLDEKAIRVLIDNSHSYLEKVRKLFSRLFSSSNK